MARFWPKFTVHQILLYPYGELVRFFDGPTAAWDHVLHVTEKRAIGSTTKFQKIANSHYRWADVNVWQFTSLPGVAAFFDFSGSSWGGHTSVLSFSLSLQLSEQIIFRLELNPLLCSTFGLTLANTISQFGSTPRQDIPFYGMIFGFVILVWTAPSDKVSRMYLKHFSARGKRGSV